MFPISQLNIRTNMIRMLVNISTKINDQFILGHSKKILICSSMMNCINHIHNPNVKTGGYLKWNRIIAP